MVQVVLCCFLISPEAMSMKWWEPARKERFYLVDRDNMGHYNSSNNSQIVQSLTGQVRAVFSAPTYWNNYVYLGGVHDHLKAFSLSNGLLSSQPVSESGWVFTYPERLNQHICKWK